MKIQVGKERRLHKAALCKHSEMQHCAWVQPWEAATLFDVDFVQSLSTAFIGRRAQASSHRGLSRCSVSRRPCDAMEFLEAIMGSGEADRCVAFRTATYTVAAILRSCELYRPCPPLLAALLILTNFSCVGSVS